MEAHNQGPADIKLESLNPEGVEPITMRMKRLSLATGSNRFRLAGIVLAVAVFVIVASGCGSSADPTSWEEAEETGKVKENFMNSCKLSYAGTTDDVLKDSTYAERLCECSYDGLRSELQFEEFKALDESLRITPDPNDLDDQEEQGTRQIWDKVEPIIQNCARQ